MIIVAPGSDLRAHPESVLDSRSTLWLTLRETTRPMAQIARRWFRPRRKPDTGTLPWKPDRLDTFGVLDRERLM
ncbi:MAG: hypothetical protein GY711_28950 [bacterium]|nr:hypothetical protein [bacterium]